MKEIEVKVLNVDREKTIETLRGLGAVQVIKPVLVKELYFTYPGDNPINKTFSSLRLRSVGDEIELTLKNKNKEGSLNFNSREELETKVENFDDALSILMQLGFVVLRKREKIREEYKCGDVKIEIDEYPRMSPYLELEASTESVLSEFLGKLGYDISMTSSGTVTDLLKQVNLNPDDLMFGEEDKKRLQDLGVL